MREVNKNIVTSVAANLKKCREDKNLTQAELAKEVGLELEAYEKMEAGVCYIQLPILIAISYALHVQLSEITGI